MFKLASAVERRVMRFGILLAAVVARIDELCAARQLLVKAAAERSLAAADVFTGAIRLEIERCASFEGPDAACYRVMAAKRHSKKNRASVM